MLIKTPTSNSNAVEGSKGEGCYSQFGLKEGLFQFVELSGFGRVVGNSIFNLANGVDGGGPVAVPEKVAYLLSGELEDFGKKEHSSMTRVGRLTVPPSAGEYLGSQPVGLGDDGDNGFS